MKNPLNKFLTPDEQKIVLFLLFFACLGLSLKFIGVEIKADESEADSLDFSQDYQVIYDLRTATGKELENLPGIGPSRAATIIEFRQKNGFASRQDLMLVKGIGKATYEKLKPYLEEFGTADANPNSALQSDLILIDLNRASLHELTLLPGIGPAKAERILEKRAELSGFQTAEQLLEVKGIGAKTLEKLRDKITIGATK
ncbi:MAG: helix-hairpin-helix domain-containing protein [Candidatus Cloacimonadales bacterium]